MEGDCARVTTHAKLGSDMGRIEELLIQPMESLLILGALNIKTSKVMNHPGRAKRLT